MEIKPAFALMRNARFRVLLSWS